MSDNQSRQTARQLCQDLKDFVDRLPSQIEGAPDDDGPVLQILIERMAKAIAALK